MPTNICKVCELGIAPIKQLTEEEINKLSEHMSTKDICEYCLIASLDEYRISDY